VDKVDLLLHPVRLRIVNVMSGGRTCTTAELCARLPDVPKTSVYRHVGHLVDAGVLEVAKEERVRGATERHYRLRRDRATIGTDEAAAMTLADHRQGFTAAMAALLAEFNAYLDRDGADPTADSVGYRQGLIWLTDDELAEMVASVTAILAANAANKPAPDRRPHLVSAILFPAESPPQP
jgi:hypothetical protein